MATKKTPKKKNRDITDELEPAKASERIARGESGASLIAAAIEDGINRVTTVLEPKADALVSAITRGFGMPVSLAPQTAAETRDQSLWTAIRSSCQMFDFQTYQAFIANVFDPDGDSKPETLADGTRPLRRFFGVEAYEMLKFSTQAFLILQSGVAVRKGGPNGAVGDFDPDFAPARGARESTDRGVNWNLAEANEALVAYLGTGNGRLPYLDVAVRNLVATGIAPKSGRKAAVEDLDGSQQTTDETMDAMECNRHSLLSHLGRFPLMLELIWSYWREEGALVQTMNAVCMRFQNRRGPNAHDPLLHLKLDPLRPLSNILWGYVQSEHDRLTLARRCYEYDSEYGLSLIGKAVPTMRTAESRSKFLEAFNNLLAIAYQYCKEADDTTVRADAFPVLNALKEVHQILAFGAHNQFGDLPWTARVEMLTQQWILARPEMREFLAGPPMVTYPEAWMGQVETMRQLQGWSDVGINHFRDLSVFGEQLLLSIRYGNWSNISVAANAANWATYWRTEIQSYMHSYRAVTGVDLTSDSQSSNRNEQPAILHRRRAELSRGKPSNGIAPRRLNLR